MNLDALLANFAGPVLGNRKEAPFRAQQDAEAANGRQFASLLSGFDSRDAPATRADVVDDAADANDDRFDRRVGDERPDADPASNSPAPLQAFVTAPAYDMSRPPTAIARPESGSSPFESSTGDEVLSTAEQNASIRGASGAATARGFSSLAAPTAPAPFTFASDRRAVDDDGGMSRSSIAEPQAPAGGAPSTRHQPSLSTAPPDRTKDASAASAMAADDVGAIFPSDVRRTSAMTAQPPAQRRDVRTTVSPFDGAMSPSRRPETRVVAATPSDGASTATLPTETEQGVAMDVSERDSSTFEPAARNDAGAISPFERRFAFLRFDPAVADIAEPSAERGGIDDAAAPTGAHAPSGTLAAQISEVAPAIAAVALDNAPATTRASFAASGAPAVATMARDRMAAPTSSGRASNDLRSIGSEAAAPLDSSAAFVAPGSDGDASEADRKSDHRAFAEARRAQSIGAGQAESTEIARAREASSKSPADVQSAVATAGAAASADDASTSDVAPQPIGTLAILAPVTQLPSAFAELLAPQARSLIASASLAAASTEVGERAAVVVDPQRQSVAPKILTIELEPASLGAVTVKMKLAHSGIDMRISVESTEALRRLDSTRDQLVEAMQASGCVVDSCTIQIGQRADGANAMAASDGGTANAQSNGTGAGREEQSVGRQGAGHGGQDSDRRRGAGGETSEPTSKSEARRGADRRGNGVYL